MDNIIIRVIERFKEDGPIKFSYRAISSAIIKILSSRRNLHYRMLRLKMGKRFILKNIQGNKMWLDLEDEGLSRDLLFEGIREPFSTRILQKEVRAGNVVVDIGANIGYYVLMEAKRVGRRGKVYAIEPVPQNIEMLKANIQLNKYSNVRVFQIAIGDKNKTASMFVSSKRNLATLVLHGKYRPKTISKINVKVLTLDKFLKDKQYPDLIRMDVEGYEYNIIKGMKKILKSNKPLKLFIEFHPSLMKRKHAIYLLKRLKTFGFKIKKITFEPPPEILSNINALKITNFFDKKLVGLNIRYGVQKMTIENILNNIEKIEKARLPPHILFERIS